MILRSATLIFLLVVCFEATEPLPKVDRIELREGAWSRIHVQIDKQGIGRYELSDYPHTKVGSFTITQQHFVALLKRLEPFQRESGPMPDENSLRALDAPCPDGVPMVTDAGMLWIHWVGHDYSRHYIADYGCDYERNRARNQELRSIVRSLPVPYAR